MLEFRSFEQLSVFIKVNKNILIGILNELACIRSIFRKFTLTVNKLYKRKIVLTSYIRIVFTKCRCNMYNTCTICHSNVRITYYVMSLLTLLKHTFLSALKERLVFLSLKVSTYICLKYFICRLII